MRARKAGENLPVNLPPRGLTRLAAADYVGVGGRTFDRMVADGSMPQPIRIYGRTIWDRLAVDKALQALSDADAAQDPWEGAQV